MTHPAIKDALGGYEPTPEQKAAIEHPPTPLGVIAGAGSGKTAVMAGRIAQLVVTGEARPSQILGLTFTNKAAGELEERIQRSLSFLDLPAGEEVSVFTYNAFADKLLRDFGPLIGIEPDVGLLSTAQSYMLMSRLLEEVTFEKLEVTFVPGLVNDARSLADACANHLIIPEKIIAADEAMLAEAEASGKRVVHALRTVLTERPEICRLVRAYMDRKVELARIDYGDQIAYAFKIVNQRPEVAQKLRDRWPFVLLDEYQDTNVAQRRLMRAIYPAGSAVTVVGDPDQAIYAWRGATLHNILSFGSHFPTEDGSSASSLTLQTSFRSGRRILECADAIIGRVPTERRGGDKVLRHHPSTGEGSVTVDLFESELDEARSIAEDIKRITDPGGDGIDGKPVTYEEVAVLCRKRRLFGRIQEILREAGIPVEVVGLGGLLTVPEVVDLLSYLKLIVYPGNNIAFARIAMGPRWRIHFRDMAALARWAAINTSQFKEQLQGLDADNATDVDPGEMRFSLSEALGRLDEVADLSDDARDRFAQMHNELEGLRGESRSLTLAENVERALHASGIEDELIAAGTDVAEAARANLSSFLDSAARFAPLEGEASLETFLEYLEAASMEDDLEIAQPQHGNSVKLMTIHQAKGLEFDAVFIPGLGNKIFPDAKVTNNPYSSKKELPFHIREDAAYLPPFESVMSRFKEALKEREMEEERRLAYVALTRARKSLFLSCAHWYGEDRSTPAGPGEFFIELAGAPATEEKAAEAPHPAVTLRTIAERPDDNPLRVELEKRAAGWPPSDELPLDALFPEGWRSALLEARKDPAIVDELVGKAGVDRGEWSARRAEVAEQLELVTAPVPPPPIDERLTSLSVSNMVQLARCPKQFYWSVVRPLPRRPSRAARLGNDIHRWIQINSFGQQRLDDPEEWPDLAPEEVGDRPDSPLPTEEALKRSFKASRFAAKRPRYIEQPFAVSLEHGYLVRGRIDAIYVEDEVWELVDYKTGAQPAEDDEIAKLQLAIYALAAETIWGIPREKIKVTYFYLKSGNMVTTPASELSLSEADLVAMFEKVGSRVFEPVPTPICHSCDFLRFCDAGKAYVVSQAAEPSS